MNMTRINYWILTIGLLILAALIGAAVILQSAYLLYSASVMPFLIVPFLPDLTTKQKLRMRKQKGRIHMYRSPTSSENPQTAALESHTGFLLIDFLPGAIHWNKGRLVFTLDDVKASPVAKKTTSTAAALPVLAHDFLPMTSSGGKFSIRMDHLRQRLNAQSFTTREVTRLVIRMDDLQALLSSNRRTRKPQRSVDKGVQA